MTGASSSIRGGSQQTHIYLDMAREYSEQFRVHYLDDMWL